MRDTWKSFWYKQYANILPLLAVVLCFILRLFDKTDIFYLKNIDQALTAVITAEAIIISLFSVMLTMLADSKHDSPVIQFFFQHADSEYFVKTLIRCVMVGMLSILFSVGMFFIRPHRAFLILRCGLGYLWHCYAELIGLSAFLSQCCFETIGRISGTNPSARMKKNLESPFTIQTTYRKSIASAVLFLRASPKRGIICKYLDICEEPFPTFLCLSGHRLDKPSAVGNNRFNCNLSVRWAVIILPQSAVSCS